jgi:hypothetical protein
MSESCKKRKSGFSWPWHPLQVLAMIYIIFTFISGLLSSRNTLLTIALFCTWLITVASAFMISLNDPSELGRQNTENALYCYVCDQQV